MSQHAGGCFRPVGWGLFGAYTLFHWMPELGFGFLRRSTDYIRVVEVRHDDIFSLSKCHSDLTPLLWDSSGTAPLIL